MPINTGEELGRAIRDGRSPLEIEGDLRNGVKRIRAVSKVAWWTVSIGLALAIGLFMTGIGIPAALAVAGAAAAVLGGAVIIGIKIGAAAGGIKGLEVLRAYREIADDGKVLRLDLR